MSDKKLPPEFADQPKPVETQIRGLTRRDFVKLASAAAAVGAGVGVPAVASAAPKPKMSTPIITCVPGDATQASISIVVTAGATGAPAGFTIQWETLDQYQNGPDGIPNTSDDNTWTGTQCGASFSGNASGSQYNLGPGESVTVNIGELLFDNGASTTCPEALVCGTTYVFRAFAHADSTRQRSDFTGTLQCSTLPCFHDVGGCTYTQGFWKTHGPADACIKGNNLDLWPAAALPMALGTTNYSDLELCSILNTPAQGNGLLTLAHQLIAAKLNIGNGADSSAIASTIVSADALIGSLVIPPGGTDSLSAGSVSALVTALTNYNEGATGPGHCQDEILPE